MDDLGENKLEEKKKVQLFEDELNDILTDLGISYSEKYNLILYNDNINNMIHVVVALYEVCKLSNDNCIQVMMEAHIIGRAIVLTDELEKVLDLKNGLDKRGLTISIEISR